MRRLLAFLLALTVVQFVLGLAFEYFGLIAVAGLGWWAWSYVDGRRRA